MNRPDPEYLATLTERTQKYIADLEAEVERLRGLLQAVRDEGQLITTTEPATIVIPYAVWKKATEAAGGK